TGRCTPRSGPAVPRSRAGLPKFQAGCHRAHKWSMERLSGLDASFLYAESATVPLHVCSVVELDTSTIPGGYCFERFRDDLTTRIKALPEFRAKLADSQLNLDHPVWIEDNDFDLSFHLQRIALPSPGGRKELAQICG